MPASEPQAPGELHGDLVASDLGPETPLLPDGPLIRVAYVLGGAGLAAATLSDSLAVAGRHTGVTFLGSIELVQAAVVLLASAAMLVATLAGTHASVHFVTARVSPAAAARLARTAALLAALAFVLLAAGSAWVGAELWNGHERTELLHIPLRWLRLLWLVAALAIAGCFLRAAWRSRP
jgi:TRAP-type transport system small permease protein